MAEKYEKFGPRGTNPTLSKVQLTLMLMMIGIVPSVLTVGLFFILPQVSEGQLPVEFVINGVPTDPSYYELPAEKRPPLQDAKVSIKNMGDMTWTQINVVINRGYEIRDPHKTVKPGETVTYRFDKFYDRSGFTFEPELSPIRHLRIFARQADENRASIHRDISVDDYEKPILNQPKQKQPPLQSVAR